MYVRSQVFFGRGIFSRFLTKTLRKIAKPTLKKVTKIILKTTPVLKKVVKQVAKNRHIRTAAKEGLNTAVDRIINKEAPIQKSDKNDILKVIGKTAQQVAKIPEIKKLAKNNGKTLLRDLNIKPNKKVKKTLNDISALFSSEKKIKKNPKKRDLQIKKRTNRGWKKLNLGGSGLILQ